LQQRTSGAEQNERQADGKGEQAKDAPGGIDLYVSSPENLRGNRQPQQTDEQQPEVENGLAFWRETARSGIGVEIAEEESGLKKDETECPNGGGGSEPGKN
jgi:hypothetical protein